MACHTPPLKKAKKPRNAITHPQSHPNHRRRWWNWTFQQFVSWFLCCTLRYMYVNNFMNCYTGRLFYLAHALVLEDDQLNLP